MPLSELYRMDKGKLDSIQEKNPTCSTDPSFVPENDFVELVWENGQILMQGQSSRARKGPTCNSLPSHIPKIRDKDIGNGTNSKFGKFGTMDSFVNEIPLYVPSAEMGLNQDDDIVSWLNYPIDLSLQPEYCSDFLPELSGVTVNELSNQNNNALIDKRSSNQSTRDSRTVSIHNGFSFEQRNASKVSSAGGGEATSPRTSASHLYSMSSQLCQTSFPSLRSRISDNIGDCMKNAIHHAVCGDLVRDLTTASGFPSTNMQKQDPVPCASNSSLMNFSHFSRPAALVKANLQNIGMMAVSGLSSIERMGIKDKGSDASSSNPTESALIDSSSDLQRGQNSQCQPTLVPSKLDAKPSEVKPLEEPLAAKQSEGPFQEEALKKDKNPHQILGESATRGLTDDEKTIEPVVASSSVCSGNSVERASDDPTHNLKRKYRETEESEYPSEEVEEESEGVKKATPARGRSGYKRSRAAEVHNLSERRRRDRINEKMRALQELIPNCNKVDKASMLDEAIDYLKMLQLQVQIMSMGAGLYMSPMMLPTGMQHMLATHIAHFSPMGVGMGMGMGMSYGMGMPDMNGGFSACPMIQVPPMQGAHFPGPPISGQTALHGMAGSNLQLFGLPGQGLPMSMPHAPLIPFSGGHLMTSTMGLHACGLVGPMENLDPAQASSSKDPMQNVSLRVMQNNGANHPMNQTSSQCHATNKGFEQSALVQNKGQASGSGAVNSTNGNDIAPSRADCYD